MVDKPKGIGMALNYSTSDVAQLAQRARQHNARIVEGPVNRPWTSANSRSWTRMAIGWCLTVLAWM